MPIKEMKLYTREHIQNNKTIIFVFGDNLERRGLGGQAAACRGESNTIGIPTKHSPQRYTAAYFTDEDYDTVKPTLDEEFSKIKGHLNLKRTIIFPEDGIGTGLAELPKRAPKIYNYIQYNIYQLKLKYP